MTPSAPGVLPASLVGDGLEHLGRGVPALLRGILQVAGSESLHGLGPEVGAGLP